MNIHEYQAKKLLADFSIPTLKGFVVQTSDEAVQAAKDLGGELWVVKAQIHAGGRGHGGGVKLAKTLDEVREHADSILGIQLVTPQTGPNGQKVRRVYIESGRTFLAEFYLSFLVDRNTSQVTLMASSEGGMDIEEVAEKTPEKIVTISFDPTTGFQPFHGRKLVSLLGLQGPQAKALPPIIQNLYRAFIALDASLLEINPFVWTQDEQWMALDAKMSFDGNALYRHKAIEAMRDFDEEDPTEVQATQFGLNYVKLDGSIGCMVNGAGLAMATMDIIQLHGGSPANFLDVGGGASPDQVTAAFKILLADPNVQAVLVNIFGGIMRCDVIAQGIITAAREVRLDIPLVARLEGTNVDIGRRILEESGLPVIAATDLNDAAAQAVAAIAHKGGA